MKLVELEPGDILIVRVAQGAEPPPGLQQLAKDLGLFGVVFLDESTEMVALTAKQLEELGLVRVDPNAESCPVCGERVPIGLSEILRDIEPDWTVVAAISGQARADAAREKWRSDRRCSCNGVSGVHLNSCPLSDA